MEIEQEFSQNQKIILVVSDGDYYKELLENLKKLSGKSICYVTLNKTYNALREDFERNNIDIKEIMIVDAISKTVKPTQNVEKNCFFVSSPGALTELAIAIKKFLNYGFEYLIFDSLNSLIVYRKLPIVKRWISSIMGNIKESNTRAIFYTLNLDDQQDLIKEAKTFTDKVVNLNKNKGKDSVLMKNSSKEKPVKKKIKIESTKINPKDEIKNKGVKNEREVSKEIN
jgi:KaiC/GvpD/RAD55 family RecA-like ATPase